MATPPPPPVPALGDDLVEDVLLRFPPDDPARLVRAALVCKGWRRLVSDPLFRRRFRARHRVAPMLGFLYCRRAPIRFEPTTTATPTPFRPRLPPPDPIRWVAVDARHGRVLVLVNPLAVAPGEESLAVWCPVTGDLRTLPMPRFQYGRSWTAALLCAAAGCAHLDCGCGPFLVVFAGTDRSEKHTSVCVYRSESGAWSELTSVQHIAGTCINKRPNVLVGNAVCFVLQGRTGSVLKHDLVTREVSVIDLPPAASKWYTVLTTTAEEGGLGFATTNGSRLLLWSRDAGSERDAGWAQSREIELMALLPAEALRTSPEVVGFADGAGAVLVRTSGGFFFTVDMKSGCVRKIGKGLSHYYVVPYFNFCTPVLPTSSSGAGPKRAPSTAPQTGGAHVLASRPKEIGSHSKW